MILNINNDKHNLTSNTNRVRIFKIKNKKYTAKTNKKGVATVKIKKLKVGKYTILTSFKGIKIKNKITVRK